MDGMDWVEDTWESFDDSDFLPSPSLALAKRLRGGRGSGKKVVPSGGARPTTPMPPQMRGEMARVYETMKRLEEKQDVQTKQLAMLQSRSAGLQSADLFGMSLSSAIANGAGPAANGDWAAVIAQAAPLLQNAQGAGASFKAKPWSTLLFPAGALGLHIARKPGKVQFIVNDRRRTKAAGAADVEVSIISPDGGTIRYVRGAAFADVKRNSTEYTGPIKIEAASADRFISAAAFFLWRPGDRADLEVLA